MTNVTDRLYKHMFYEAQEETNKAVEILRRVLVSMPLTETQLYKDVKQFVEDWDKAGEPFDGETY